MTINHDAVAAALLRYGPGRIITKTSAPRKSSDYPRPKKLPPKVRKFRKHHRCIAWRAARKAKGLNTATGLQLVRKKHPQLPKGNRKTYLRLYARKARKLAKGAAL
jgi:hypothetical protein